MVSVSLASLGFCKVGGGLILESYRCSREYLPGDSGKGLLFDSGHEVEGFEYYFWEQRRGEVKSKWAWLCQRVECLTIGTRFAVECCLLPQPVGLGLSYAMCCLDRSFLVLIVQT